MQHTTSTARSRNVLLAALALVLGGSATADSHPTVDDLAWMSGTWRGPAGEQTLEENWSHPHDGSIASLVRMTAGGTTRMVELIVVEEENDSLVLRLQQWGPGLVPLSEGPNTMTLAESAADRVTFTNPEAGGIRLLTYSRPAPDRFNIDIEMADGNAFQINLTAHR